MAQPKRRYTVYDHMDFPDYVYQEYPKMVYQCDGPKTKAVGSDEELAEALADGWVDHPGKVQMPQLGTPAREKSSAELRADLAAAELREKAQRIQEGEAKAAPGLKGLPA